MAVWLPGGIAVLTLRLTRTRKIAEPLVSASVVEDRTPVMEKERRPASSRVAAALKPSFWVKLASQLEAHSRKEEL